MTFKEDIESGDLRRQLEAVRDHLRDEIESCESTRYAAPLIRQLTEVVTQIAELPGNTVASSADQLAAKRHARRNSA